MTEPDSLLLTRVEQGIATLTLNRPEVRNALSPNLLTALENGLQEAGKNPDVRVIILTGSGEGFMAGGDIRHFQDSIGRGNLAAGFGPFLDRVNSLTQMIRDLPRPVIAAVNGACAGFGVSLMLACDLAVAAENVTFTMAYDRLGLSPDGGASWHLVRILGLRRASELLLTGRSLDATTAANWGLINRVMPAATLLPAVTEIARLLTRASPAALARTKQLLNTASTSHLSHQLDGEAEHFINLALGPDFAEGVAAFLEKRAPKFKDRT